MQEVDLFVIGGGINGCAIARDAAGRGLSVVLAEKGDLAQGTSSASTKLFHGGLRYLEYFEFRLVREALEERETLLRAMPHIAWPMRFVLPLYPGMRFETETPAGKLLARLMPWMKGRRPDWMIRLGLFLYDHLGGRKILPGTRSLDLRRDPAGAPLKPDYVKAYEYSDVWVMDSRLVSLTARDAAARGVTILTRTPVTEARPEGGVWVVTAGGKTYRARSLVNAGGPWVDPVRGLIQGASRQGGVRLVRGSHIVTRKLYDHDRCYFFQGADGRIIFAIPYEDDFTLIGTTDADHTGAPDQPVCTEAERDYLLAFANGYFAKTLSAADVVWSYAGVRPLYNDGTKSATAATRDYVLALEGTPQLLNIFGGKITTHRRLAEAAVAKLFPTTKPWTAGVPLPGGNFGHDGVPGLVQALRRAHPTAPAERLVRLYGTEALEVAARGGDDLGAGLKTGEVDWLVEKEFARTAEDILWRRTKLGLTLPPEGVQALESYLARRSA